MLKRPLPKLTDWRALPLPGSLCLTLVFVLCLATARPATAQVMADWGTVATPIANDVTFSFAQYDVTRNFTHQYLFSLEGSADASYTVTFNFDPCRNGCGNPGLSYGIYDMTGGAITPVSGSTYVLTAGAYAFQVKGDGFGAGNSVDYWGSVTISAGAGEIVSPVPEPEMLVLFGLGLPLVAWRVRRRKALAALIVPAAIALQGCQQPPAVPTQVVARVNGAEISVHQLESAARVERAMQPGEPDRGMLLEKLIDRQLAVQQALERKLDRQPEVLQRLEELRRDALATAYAEAVAAASARPSQSAVEHFYAGHPELFAQRKIYRLRELALPVESPLAAEAKRRLATREPLEEIARWLAGEGVRAGTTDVLRAAEQLPMQALERLHGAAEGQTVVFESPRTLYAYRVLGFQSAPLDLAAATPLIAEHLARQEGRKAVAAELKALRSVAAIEYAGGAAAGDPARTLARN